MMYTFIDAPPGGATNYSFDGERIVDISSSIGDISNSIGDISNAVNKCENGTP